MFTNDSGQYECRAKNKLARQPVAKFTRIEVLPKVQEITSELIFPFTIFNRFHFYFYLFQLVLSVSWLYLHDRSAKWSIAKVRLRRWWWMNVISRVIYNFSFHLQKTMSQNFYYETLTKCAYLVNLNSKYSVLCHLKFSHNILYLFLLFFLKRKGK